MRVTVHTKTGKKLVSFPEVVDSEEYQKWWMNHGAFGDGTVRIGRFVITKENIDFVEFDE